MVPPQCCPAAWGLGLIIRELLAVGIRVSLGFYGPGLRHHHPTARGVALSEALPTPEDSSAINKVASSPSAGCRSDPAVLRRGETCTCNYRQKSGRCGRGRSRETIEEQMLDASDPD